MQGGWEGEGNIDSDPLFVDPENGDFTLQSNSPCIDAGDPGSEYDPDGTIADMGAYYFHQTFGYTYVPDDNFEQALIDLDYDDVLDDYVLTENISGVTSLEVFAKEISDLTGIEDFTALTWLDCGGNQLTTLDVSANTALHTLVCYENQLTSLDVSANTALTYRKLQ